MDLEWEYARLARVGICVYIFVWLVLKDCLFCYGERVVQVKYTEHLKMRLKMREIPDSYPRTIYENFEQKFYDTIEERYIAVKKLEYNGKIRPMMIAYEEKEGIVEIVTIHPITEEKVINREMGGRWMKRG